jgi:putative heme-binding domain-containing protein
LKAPAGWAELSPSLISSSNKDVCRLAVGLALQFGDTSALEFLKKRAQDTKLNAEDRRVALETLMGAKATGTSELLQGLLSDVDVRAVAIRGLAAFDEPAIAQKILELYPTLTTLEKNDAVNTLAARRAYAQALVKALKEKTIPRGDISAYAARLLESLGDADVNAWLKENWGVSRPAAEETLKELKRYKDIVAKADVAKNDASRGRAVFKKTCASCHTLFDDGGNVGPNLTGSGRVEAEYVLQNLLDPNALVAQDYLTWIVKTKDGRVLSGLIRGETDQTVTVLTATESITLPKGEVASRKQSQQSMMPEGLLQTMREQELLDLLTYLKAPGQVPLK